MLAALLERRPIDEPIALVVAHPDDETLAAGGSLHLFRRLLLVHVTDGAPRGLGDAAREGFAGPAEYAAARARELDAALALSGAMPELVSLGIADQEATACVPTITGRLSELFAELGIQTVLTHSYEGGHPDHDAVAMAVHALGAEIVEFAGYHAGADGQLETNLFLEHALFGSGLEHEANVLLGNGDLARKRAMLACFHTQREILSRFDPAIERFRLAPAYDFSQPPHPGRLLYEEWGWMTGAAWRERVRCAA
jgi:LmbE family N-acetylglucosaminyl deacetylase